MAKGKFKGFLKLTGVVLLAGVVGTGVYYGIKYKDKVVDGWNKFWGVEQQKPETPDTPGDDTGNETPDTPGDDTGNETPDTPGVDVQVVLEVKFMNDQTQHGETQQVQLGRCATLPTEEPTKEGYKFKGYALEGTEEVIDVTSYEINENTTFVAIFEKVHTVNVTVDDNTTTSEVADGEGLTLTTPTKEGYEFLGYAVEGTDEIIDLSTFVVTQDVNLVAVFEKVHTVNVTVDGNTTTQEVRNGEGLTLTAQTKEGYEFLGYAVEGTDEIIDLSTYVVTQDVNLVAVFKEIIQTIPLSIVDGVVTGLTDSTVTEVTIPSTYSLDEEGNCIEGADYTVTAIGEKAFEDCSSLTSITMPDSVTSIGENAFHRCYKLTNITIPDSVETIGKGAFSDCSSLTSIIVPDNVTNINTYTFYACINLTSVTLGNRVTNIGNMVFHGCRNLKSIAIPDSVTSIGNNTFNSCSSLTSITIPAGVTSISANLFANTEDLIVIFESGAPAEITTNSFIATTQIYVPDDAYDTYVSTWTTYASQIHKVSELESTNSGDAGELEDLPIE